MKDQVEERLKLYEDGTVPKKNLDVMKEAIAAVNAANEAVSMQNYLILPLRNILKLLSDRDTQEEKRLLNNFSSD